MQRKSHRNKQKVTLVLLLRYFLVTVGSTPRVTFRYFLVSEFWGGFGLCGTLAPHNPRRPIGLLLLNSLLLWASGFCLISLCGRIACALLGKTAKFAENTSGKVATPEILTDS